MPYDWLLFLALTGFAALVLVLLARIFDELQHQKLSLDELRRDHKAFRREMAPDFDGPG